MCQLNSKVFPSASPFLYREKKYPPPPPKRLHGQKFDFQSIPLTFSVMSDVKMSQIS